MLRFFSGNARSLTIVGCLLAGVLFPAAASASPTRIARNESTEMSSQLTVTFWVDFDHYKVLPDGTEKGLLIDPVIKAPAGVEVTQLETTISKGAIPDFAQPHAPREADGLRVRPLCHREPLERARQ